MAKFKNGSTPFVHPVTHRLIGADEWYDGPVHIEGEELKDKKELNALHKHQAKVDAESEKKRKAEEEAEAARLAAEEEERKRALEEQEERARKLAEAQNSTGGGGEQ